MELAAIERVDLDVLDELPCRTHDPELFFAESPADVEYAKSLCRDCPVRPVCLAGALERREPWGVWGGELFLQGVVVPRKRPRGRPRKSDRGMPGPSVPGPSVPGPSLSGATGHPQEAACA